MRTAPLPYTWVRRDHQARQTSLSRDTCQSGDAASMGPHRRALAASSRPISPQRSMVNSGFA
eukprot:2405746-Amphidinium_carterae.1